ncbi:MAG: hypothetical protein IJC19_08610 [Clostridia bacterium]|nr:hypothetical protein [Clostridia bacterium]
MKPFLGVNITEDKKNQFMDGTELMVATVSEVQKNAFDKAGGELLEHAKKAELPLSLRILKYISSLVALVGFVALVRSWSNGTNLVEAYNNAPAILWATGICAVVWGILTFLGWKKKTAVEESDEAICSVNNVEQISKDIEHELGVPADAKTVDILVFFYKIKNGEPVAKETSPLAMSPYTNLEFSLFKDEDNLYLADLESKYAFPLESLKGIRTVKKSIFIPLWNKDTPFDREPYKIYKLAANQFGQIKVKPFHILEAEINGETYGIYFPSYECPTFEAMTGLKAEQA